MVVEKNKVVSISYSAIDDTGNVVDSNLDFEPLEYLHGHGNILQTLEAELNGLKKDDEKKVTLTADQAYGEFNPELVVEVNREQFPEGVGNLELGAMVQSSDGQELIVTDIDGERIVLDGNHPLAGRTLHFSVTIRSVREATAEELSHQHAHAHNDGSCGSGCGCSH